MLNSEKKGQSHMRILTENQETILKEERKVLNDLRSMLVSYNAAPEDGETLGQAIYQLDELFLLVVVGEFNSGKSAFINALLGQKLLKEGVTPTTTQINILRFGEQQERLALDENLHVITLPVPMLKDISIVDTPGTNAIIREHEEITSKFVPQSDLVLFITSSDRPFTESERLFLAKIHDWGKKVVFVINKIDILQDAKELEQIINFVAQNALSLLGITSEIFPVSARKALIAKQGQPQFWQESGFETLEHYIQETLDEKGRLLLKFRSPLGVATHLVEKYKAVTQSRLDLLDEDFQMLSDVDAQLAVFKEDMQRDFHFRMSDIENILLEMEQRGDAFFDEVFRLGRIFDLLSKDRIQRNFEHEVVGDVPQQIERKVNELIDWLVEANLRQWQAVTDHLAERRREHQTRIVGDAGGGTFHYDRDRIMDAVGREAMRVVDTYDKVTEAKQIAEGAQNAVATSLAVEAGAIGLGTLVTILATTAAGDVTGILAATVIAALGLFIIPARRSQAKTQMHHRVSELRKMLMDSLCTQFEQEIERGLHHVDETIAPYTRFIRAEHSKLDQMSSSLEKHQNDLDRINVKIDDMI
jgi:small GTP-binding protein